jgi:hypothetical protein
VSPRWYANAAKGAAANHQSATVTRGPITQAVTATGTLNPVVNVQVGSQVSGNIAKLFVDFNSQVKAGQVVAQIDPALFQAKVTHLRHRRVQCPVELCALAHVDFDRVDCYRIFVQRSRWRFLRILSCAQSCRLGSDRSAALRMKRNL